MTVENPNATPTPVEPEATATVTESTENSELTLLQEKYNKLKEEASKWESYSKKNFKKLEVLGATEDEDFQNLQSRLKGLEEESRNLKVAAVASKYSLPEKVLSQLSGNTAEELEADAQEWAAALYPEGKAPEAQQKVVKPVFTQGPNTDGPAPAKMATNINELRAQIKANQNK